MSSFRALIALLWLTSAGTAAAQSNLEHLTINTASGSHPFAVEVMRTRAELEKGLMFRHTMPADRGMLFDFGQPRPVLMWMKNTYLPLDMVFIDKGGKVINVARNAEPMSEATIPSGGPALGVLEINAGTADTIGLKPGDEVHASMFTAH